jgi:hypothetical protein
VVTGAGGCQIWRTIPWALGMSNERTHYTLPNATAGRGPRQDVILYRSGKTHTLWASRRVGTSAQVCPPFCACFPSV